MSARRIIATLFCLFIPLVAGCQKSPPAARSASSASKLTEATAEQTPSQVPLSASIADLQEVIIRNYQGAVTPDTSRPDSFVVGDFNSDNSQDIAVVVKPGKGRLSELNSEYANWILEDPISVGLRAEQISAQRLPENPAPVLVRERDILLAVIHGHQKAGWRDPKARQTYLLKNVVGDEMKVEQAQSLRRATPEERLPSLRGDVIRETRAGTPGFIYWTGAKYAWHSASPTH